MFESIVDKFTSLKSIFVSSDVTNISAIKTDTNNTTAVNPNIMNLPKDITLQGLYEEWKAFKYPQMTIGGCRGYEYAYSKIPQEMKNSVFLDLVHNNWQSVITDLRFRGLHFYSQKRIKNFCGQMYKFAIRNNLCMYNVAPALEMGKNIPAREKCVYSDIEIQTLYERRNEDDFIKVILILIFTGLRISEFLRLNPYNDIFLDDEQAPNLIVRKSKTLAGTNRPVIIFNKILPFLRKLVEEAKKEDRDFLLKNADGNKMTYSNFIYRYKRTLKNLGMKHTIHECRHTFASVLDAVDANDMAIRKMIGHAGFGVTKKTYTHKNLNHLIAAISLLENNYLLDPDEIEEAKQEILSLRNNKEDFTISESLKQILMRDSDFLFLGKPKRKRRYTKKVKDEE